MESSSILWRRLDVPGHDACRLERTGHGWRLEGMAVFRHDGGAAGLAYGVECDADWRALGGHVRGHLGARRIEQRIERSANGAWRLDGALAAGLGDCLDLDFGFTPATNLLVLRRLALEIGASVQAPAAWLDAGAATLVRLPQTYERRSRDTYWYESPSAGYAALLELGPTGFARTYPGLWEQVR